MVAEFLYGITILIMKGLLYYYCLAIGVLIVRKTWNTVSNAGKSKDQKLQSKKLMIVFGSGGHTTEMLLMLTKNNSFNFTKYKQVQFVIGHSDTWSLKKI